MEASRNKTKHFFFYQQLNAKIDQNQKEKLSSKCIQTNSKIKKKNKNGKKPGNLNIS